MSLLWGITFANQVVFISETPVGLHERTSIKEHLVRHGSKHKIQVHTTKRNSNKNKNKIKSLLVKSNLILKAPHSQKIGVTCSDNHSQRRKTASQ